LQADPNGANLRLNSAANWAGGSGNCRDRSCVHNEIDSLRRESLDNVS
jgi:hypothetical protein